jgi:hypothetical protein
LDINASEICSRLFADVSSQAIKSRARPMLLKDVATGLKPKTGIGYGFAEVTDFFDKQFVEDLESAMVRLNVSLIEFNREPIALDSFLKEKIKLFAEHLVDNLNMTLAKPEQGELEVQAIRVVYSNGQHEQLGSDWHVDSYNYITSAINLKGRGTIIDANPNEQKHPNKRMAWANTGPTLTIEVPEGQIAVFNSFTRYAALEGDGALPVRHRAPDGKSDARLGILIWLKPKNYMAGNLIIDMTRANTQQEIDRIREEIKRIFFPE